MVTDTLNVSLTEIGDEHHLPKHPLLCMQVVCVCQYVCVCDLVLLHLRVPKTGTQLSVWDPTAFIGGPECC